MIRIFTTIIFLTVSAPIFSQYGIDGTIAAGAHWAIWEVEKKDWNTISDGQDILIAANVALALEQAKLSDISKKKYKSVSKTDNAIKDAKTIALIAERALVLGDIALSIDEIVEGYPEVYAILSPSLIELGIEIVNLTESVVFVDKEGDTNLMNSSERFQYMQRILNEIDEINSIALHIKVQAQFFVNLRKTDESPQDVDLPSLNTANSVLLIEQQIENLITE